MRVPDEPPQHLWGASAPLRPLTGGRRNRVLRTVGLAQDLVYKTTRRDEAALRWLAPLHEAARAVGFVVPRPRESAAGRLVEMGWTAETLVAGAPIDPAGLAALAPRVARMHAATTRLPQRPGFRAARDFAVAGVDRGGDVDLAGMPSRLVATLRAAFARLPADTPVGVHGDLGPGNVLSDPTGRVALVDWDEARSDLAAFDLAALAAADIDPDLREALNAWEIACCWRIEPTHARRLALGPGHGGGAGAAFKDK